MAVVFALERVDEKLNRKELYHRDLTFQNLLSLGFNVRENEERHQISFTPSMFDKTNSKGLEVVMYFLIDRWSRTRARELFHGIWPITDRSKAGEFRNVLFDVLKSFEEGGHIPVNSVRKSLLQTATGPRFEELLFAVSSYVLRCVMSKDYSNYPVPVFPAILTLDSDSRKLVLRGAKMQVVAQIRAFLSFYRNVWEVRERWEECDRNLEERNGEIFQKLSAIRRRQSQLRTQISKYPFNLSVVNSKKEGVLQSWKALDEMFGLHSLQTPLVDRVLNGRPHEYHLDSHDFQYANSSFTHSSSLLNDSFIKETILEKDGPHKDSLRVHGLSNVWNVSASQLLQRLSNSSASKRTLFAEFNVAGDRLTTLQTKHKFHIENVKKLTVQIKKEIEKKKREIEILRQKEKNVPTSPPSAPNDPHSLGLSPTSTPRILLEGNRLRFVPPTPQTNLHFTPSSNRRQWPPSPTREIVDDPQQLWSLVEDIRMTVTDQHKRRRMTETQATTSIFESESLDKGNTDDLNLDEDLGKESQFHHHDEFDGEDREEEIEGDDELQEEIGGEEEFSHYFEFNEDEVNPQLEEADEDNIHPITDPNEENQAFPMEDDLESGEESGNISPTQNRFPGDAESDVDESEDEEVEFINIPSENHVDITNDFDVFTEDEDDELEELENPLSEDDRPSKPSTSPLQSFNLLSTPLKLSSTFHLPLQSPHAPPSPYYSRRPAPQSPFEMKGNLDDFDDFSDDDQW
jgi:hypothetical protein